MKKSLISRRPQTLKLNRETLGLLSDSGLQGVAGGATFKCTGTADCTISCTDSCCPNSCLC